MLNGAPSVRRLFENYKEVEIDYYKKTGIFPIMHTVAIREELWKERPWIAASLYKAFQKAKQLAYQRLNDLSPYKISMVWFREPNSDYLLPEVIAGSVQRKCLLKMGMNDEITVIAPKTMKARERGLEMKIRKLPLEIIRDWRNASSSMGPRTKAMIKGLGS